MKRIGIYTYYNVHNHGALLQAYALNKVISSDLSDQSFQVDFIRFVRDYSFIDNNQKSKYKLSLKSIKYYLHYLKNKGIKSFLFNIRKNMLLNRFRKCNFSFIDNPKECDLCICGSDEVFSVEIGFNKCMYGIGIDIPFVSYAASFGPSVYEDITRHGLEKQICGGLQKFKMISVRDENSREIVKQLTARNDVTLCCDPVLLYGYKKEIENCRFIKDKFILIYSYDKNLNNPEEYNHILRFAKKHSFKVYSVGFYHKWVDKCLNVDPIELLSYFKSAQFVVTDTFHGSVLSIVCNSQFVTKVRNNGNKVIFLLNQHDLSSRITNDFSNLESLYLQEIDFESVNKIVEDNRTKSLSYIKEAIK